MGDVPAISRNTLSLNAHAARSTGPKYLISLDCNSYPSLANFERAKGFETSTPIFGRYLWINTVTAQNLRRTHYPDITRTGQNPPSDF